MGVVRSIASICNEDPYKLWHAIASGGLLYQASPPFKAMPSEALRPVSSTPGPCWRCTACNKAFNDIKQLVNHITFFVRQRDKSHIELYKKIKEYADKSGKTFTQASEEILRC